MRKGSKSRWLWRGCAAVAWLLVLNLGVIGGSALAGGRQATLTVKVSGASASHFRTVTLKGYSGKFDSLGWNYQDYKKCASKAGTDQGLISLKTLKKMHNFKVSTGFTDPYIGKTTVCAYLYSAANTRGSQKVKSVTFGPS
jgi:hypothetical protein